MLGRRKLLSYAAVSAPLCAVLSRRPARAANATLDVSAPPYNASPNKSDNTIAFQAALNSASVNGGSIYVPGGVYNCSGPLTYTGPSLSIVGDGPNNSIITILHSGTGLAVNLTFVGFTFTLRDIAVVPYSALGGLVECGVSVTLPLDQSGWQNVLIENVRFGEWVPPTGSQSTAFVSALSLANSWRSRIHNSHFISSAMSGGSAINMIGGCIDTRVIGNIFDGYMVGILYNNYSEGLHFVNNTFKGGTAVQNIVSNTSQQGLSFLEVFVENCKISSTLPGILLSQVKGVYVSNTEFLCSPMTGGVTATCSLQGCQIALIGKCIFDGGWTPHNPQNIVGVMLGPSAAMPTNSSIIDSCEFHNICIAVEFGPGAIANSATNIALYQSGLTQLVDGTYNYGAAEQQVFIDESGNDTNNVTWRKSSGSSALATNRMATER